MSKSIQNLGRYFFYLLLSLTVAACGDEDDNPSPALTSDFTFAVDPVTPGKVNFTNTSTNATGYLWEFGDGNTSTLASPSHTFQNNSTYEVKLTAMGASNSGKLPGRTSGSGKTSSKMVTVANAIATPAMTASMQGQSSFTYTATSITGIRNGSNIIVRGVSSSGVTMELRLPNNATAGSTYNVAPQQPLASNASIFYTNSVSTYTADVNSCGPATGAVKVNSISPTSISGTYSGEVYNITCSGGYFTINNGTFTARF